MPIEVTCYTCGKHISKRPCDIKRSKKHYCSHECYLKTLRNKKDINCETCGKIITRKKSDIEKAKHHFCSPACHDKWRQIELIEVTCDMCNLRFFKKYGDVKRTNHNFCSKTCMGEWNSKHKNGKCAPGWKGGIRPTVTRICKMCNNEFEAFQCVIQNGRGKFCSMKCSSAWKSKNLSGKNSPNWRNGASYEPYCHKFNDEFKESIRDKFNRECFLCGKTEICNGKKLSVHHVNYDKNCLCGDTKCEFVPLCQSCHAKTNHNRDYYENCIIDKLKEYGNIK